ncbi:DUF2608 domain-containing protein [Chryseobacterium sp. JUb7]|uniref:DUF2608 domain-containing protein n=1 Tax=Chryseobacterium sp. JUb7 TaxID=2940599 RepID=UPI00216716DF|nr:DUF2608 domain-containing protein [Chryseobacterium sp. JUb7]MCS3531615.1 hypothetical protein [Chryseobacterium sp. JUb7]
MKLLSTQQLSLAFMLCFAGILNLYSQKTIDTVMVGFDHKCSPYYQAINQQAAHGITKVIFFDLDNTLFIVNNRKYGSDDWSSLISDSIKTKINPAYTKIFFDELYDSISVTNYKYLPVSPVCIQARDLINKISKKEHTLVFGLTSRAINIAVETDANLYNAGYRFMYKTKEEIAVPPDVQMANNVIYTKGGNKGLAINSFITANFPTSTNYDIYYFDDTYRKLEQAKEYIDNLTPIHHNDLVLDKAKMHYYFLNDERIKPIESEVASAYWQSFLYMIYTKKQLNPELVLKK